jgi:hypothetical protein
LTLLVWIIQEEMMSNPNLPIGFFKGQSQHLISREHLDFVSHIYLVAWLLESLECNILVFLFSCYWVPAQSIWMTFSIAGSIHGSTMDIIPGTFYIAIKSNSSNTEAWLDVMHLISLIT